VVLQPDARHQPDPYVRPLLELLDEAERYAVVLTDRQQARLFSVALGEIEEHHRAFAAADVRAPRTTGTDHLWSEKRFQRRADAHAHHHLKQVAGFLRAWQREVGFDRLVIAGPVEATGELLRLLPRGLADRVVATWKMPMEVHEPELLRQVMELHERRETEREIDLTEELLSASQGRKDAVVGLQPTLDALREGRVLKLLYTAEDPIAGGRCRRCGLLSARLIRECAFCGGEVEPVADLLGRMARHVSDAGGSLDRLHGAAADGLRREGGVGAFLRF
jgi:peptide subunit release factor 1 (eRF1)